MRVWKIESLVTLNQENFSNTFDNWIYRVNIKANEFNIQFVPLGVLYR
ncbi:hypothetical protein SRABI80_03260 [Peribacillus frigoritolerans]|jgi:hypothetical protein|nr:hypothetical protein SRABI80_03260 [Peribacillus frigoritolerans]